MRGHSGTTMTAASMTTSYKKGAVIEGEVVRITPFEVVVALDHGAKGIIRTRELSWSNAPRHPIAVVVEGQRIKARVLGLDQKQRRFSLSLRQVERDPWAGIHERYRVGQVVSRKVAHLRSGGAFVELEPAVDGFLPLREVCSTPLKRIEDALWIGDTVEAVVSRLDHNERRIELSIRQHLGNLERQREMAFKRSYLDEADEGISSVADLLSYQERMALTDLLASASPATDLRKPDAFFPLAQRLRRILIADDDPSFRSSLQRLLRRLGHEVDAVDTAEKAVSAFSRGEYDLLIIDLGFAGSKVDGLHAARELLSHDVNLPIIMVTAANFRPDFKEITATAHAAGVLGVLLKPVELSSLHRVMTCVSEGKHYLETAQADEAAGHEIEDSIQGQVAEVTYNRLLGSVRKEVKELEQETGACACILFQKDRATREVRVLARSGATLKHYDFSKYTLYAGPVDNVIRSGTVLVESDVSSSPEKFQYLDLLDFASCVGVPVKTLGNVDYALFLFHPAKAYFSDAHVKQATVTAKLIGAILAREEAEKIMEQVQPFVFAGQIGSSTMHELNNRLGSVLNDAETLMMDQEIIEADLSRAIDHRLRDEMGACIRNLERNSLAMKRITSLSMGLISKGRRELVNVNEVIQHAIDVLGPFAESHNVRMTAELEADMPATLAVPVQLEQAFVNVALNAIQHMQLAHGEGGLIVHSRFAKENVRRPIQVRFTDTGPGIHGNHLERIFDLGFSTRSDGSGLGLFTTRRLIESMSGSIKVEKSAMLVGVTFLVELPLVIPWMEAEPQ